MNKGELFKYRVGEKITPIKDLFFGETLTFTKSKEYTIIEIKYDDMGGVDVELINNQDKKHSITLGEGDGYWLNFFKSNRIQKIKRLIYE